MSTDNKDAVRVAFDAWFGATDLRGYVHNEVSAYSGYRAAHAAQAEQIELLQQALRGRQEEIGRLMCRVGELEALRDAGMGAQADIRSVALEESARIAETPFTGEQDDITMQAKDRVAAAIRALKSQPVQQPGDVRATVDMSAIWSEVAKDPAFLSDLEQGSAEVNSVLGAPATADLQAAIMALQRYEEYGNESGGGLQESPDGEYIRLDGAASLVASARPSAAQGLPAQAQGGPMTTDQAREYLVDFMLAHFTDVTFARYIRGERENSLAGDFAWQMANALHRMTSAAPQPAARELTDADIERLFRATKSRWTDFTGPIVAFEEFSRAIAAHLAGNAGASEKA